MVVNVIFTPKCWIDKATGCVMLYSKKFSISAYGKTQRQAEFMFREQVYEFLKQTMQKNKL